VILICLVFAVPLLLLLLVIFFMMLLIFPFIWLCFIPSVIFLSFLFFAGILFAALPLLVWWATQDELYLQLGNPCFFLLRPRKFLEEIVAQTRCHHGTQYNSC